MLNMYVVCCSSEYLLLVFYIFAKLSIVKLAIATNSLAKKLSAFLGYGGYIAQGGKISIGKTKVERIGRAVCNCMVFDDKAIFFSFLLFLLC